jgi:hypothetical protein
MFVKKSVKDGLKILTSVISLADEFIIGMFDSMYNNNTFLHC